MMVSVHIDPAELAQELQAAQRHALMYHVLDELHEEEAADLMAALAGRLESKAAIATAIEGRDWIQRVELIRHLSVRMTDEFRAAGLAQVETA